MQSVSVAICIGNEVAAWLIAIEDAGLFMYVKVLRQAG